MKSEVAKSIADSVRRSRSLPYGRTPPSRRKPRGGAARGPSSFGYKGFTVTGVGVAGMRLYGGYVSNLSGTNVRINDTIDSVPAIVSPPTPAVVGTEVPITGTEADPTRVCIQIDKATGACSFCALAAEPVSSGSYWYRVIHEAYLNASGYPVHKMDRRFDWTMGSPIQ